MMYNTVKKLHIELTDKCNARCPQCIRTNIETGKPHKWILKKELSLEDIKTILTLEDLAELEHINFCGNYGDPLLATDIIEICSYILENFNGSLEIHTNGSMHNEDWWWKLCEKLYSHNKKLKFYFGIDGINQEQHNRYRVGTNFNKIIDNATMCIDAGFETVWDYLVFKHNQDDIETAKNMAEELGFNNINIISTERFWEGDNYEYAYQGGTAVLERSTLEPNKKQLMNIKTYSEKNSIDCFAKARQEAFIDCLGYITPCCYLGIYLYASVVNRPLNWPSQKEVSFMFNNMNLNRLRGKLSTVVKDPWFTQLEKMHAELKPERCYMVCGAQIHKKEYT